MSFSVMYRPLTEFSMTMENMYGRSPSIFSGRNLYPLPSGSQSKPRALIPP